MKIIQLEPNPSGAYPPIQESSIDVVPPGMALVPDNLDTGAFYAHAGFVVLQVADGTVTGMEVNQAAYDAWQASLPPEADPEPTPEDDTDAMLVDHEYRLTLLELGVTEGV